MKNYEFFAELRDECARCDGNCLAGCKYFDKEHRCCPYDFSYFMPKDLRLDDSALSFWARTFIKDTSGREIQAGDVIKLNEDVKCAFGVNDGVVAFARGAFSVKPPEWLHNEHLLNRFDNLADMYGTMRGVVIGNIYDDPGIVEKLRNSGDGE